jgi:hypothetical protein
LRAAKASPPEAKIQFPYGVLNSTQPRTMVRRTHHQMEITAIPQEDQFEGKKVVGMAL